MGDYILNLLRNLLYMGSPPESDTFVLTLPPKLVATVLYASLGGLTWGSLPTAAHEFLNGAPIVIICVLWTMDMIIGTLLAIFKRNYSPRKSFYGLVKLLVYSGVLAVAYITQHDGNSLDDWLRPVIEMAVIFTEMSSVLRNSAGMMQKVTGRKSKVLEFFGSQIDDLIEEHLIKKNHQNGVTNGAEEAADSK